MVSGRQVGQGVAVLVVLVVLNVLLFVRLSGNEHLELSSSQSSREPRSSLVVWGEQFAGGVTACDMSPGARDSETALLIPEVSRGDTVIIAPGGGGVLAEGFYRHLGKDVALSLAFVLVDTRPQFAEAASRRREEELDLFLKANSRVRHMNAATVADVPLPPLSAAAVVVGLEAHHFGRLARGRFLAQMYTILEEGGQLMMMDFAPSPATADVIAFFEAFVRWNSVIGFRGEFLESDEMVQMLDSIGYAEVSATEVEFDWRFTDEKEMVRYLCAVFALTLVDLESEKEVTQLLAAVAPLRKGGTREGVTLTWTATRYLAVKRSGVVRVLSVSGTGSDDGTALHPELEPLGGRAIAAAVPEEMAPPANDWQEFKATKHAKEVIESDAERLAREFGYMFKEEPTVELGSGSYASCVGFSPFTPSRTTYVARYFFHEAGWRDVSDIVVALLEEEELKGLPRDLLGYCGFVRAADPQDCLVKAIEGDGRSPLADLRMIHCYMEARANEILRAFEKANKTPPTRLRFLEAGLPWELEDKAAFLVAALQQASAAVQERAMRHIPRTYLVAASCAPQVYDDQWDLWLDDYFAGDESKMQSFAKQWPTCFQVGESDIWRQGQPSIDLGKNLWISKPTLGLSFDFSNTKLKSRIPMHEGKDVEVVRSPAHFLEITNGAVDTNCISKHRVLQKYVEKPMLWNGYKTDFRLFVAVVSVQPPVYYMYTTQLTARVARSLYSEDSSDDSSQHVTNLSRARKEDGSDVMALGDDYIAYLEDKFPERDVREEIFSGCEEMVAAVIPLVRLTEVARLGLGSGLTGWDVILDKDLKPWLMEVNRGCDWRPNASAIAPAMYLLWAQYLDLVFNYDVDTYPDRLGGFRRVALLDD